MMVSRMPMDGFTDFPPGGTTSSANHSAKRPGTIWHRAFRAVGQGLADGEGRKGVGYLMTIAFAALTPAASGSV